MFSSQLKTPRRRHQAPDAVVAGSIRSPSIVSRALSDASRVTARARPAPQLLTRSDAHAVHVLAPLPRSIVAALSNKDDAMERVAAVVSDDASPFCAAVTIDSVLVWNYTETHPACTAIAVPSPKDALPPLVHFTAPKASGSVEPGIVLICRDGSIHHYSSISLAAAAQVSVPTAAAARIPLNIGSNVATSAAMCDSGLLVVGASDGAVFVLIPPSDQSRTVTTTPWRVVGLKLRSMRKSYFTAIVSKVFGASTNRITSSSANGHLAEADGDAIISLSCSANTIAALTLSGKLVRWRADIADTDTTTIDTGLEEAMPWQTYAYLGRTDIFRMVSRDILSSHPDIQVAQARGGPVPSAQDLAITIHSLALHDRQLANEDAKLFFLTSYKTSDIEQARTRRYDHTPKLGFAIAVFDSATPDDLMDDDINMDDDNHPLYMRDRVDIVYTNDGLLYPPVLQALPVNLRLDVAAPLFLFFIVTHDAIVMTEVDSTQFRTAATAVPQFEEVVRIHSDQNQRFIGSHLVRNQASEYASLDASESSATARLLACAIGLGIISIDLNLAKIKPDDDSINESNSIISTTAADDVPRQASQVKTKLEQAVAYGSQSANSLRFDFKVSSGKSLDAAVDELASEIVNSRFRYASPSLDISASLQSRQKLLHDLISFLREHDAMALVSVEVRARLRNKLEMLLAASAMWQTHNDLLSMDEFLPACIRAYYGTSFSDEELSDPVRDFFRFQLHDLSSLITRMDDAMQNPAEYELASTASIQTVVISNKLIAAPLIAVASSRSDPNRARVFGNAIITALPWTSTPQLAHSVAGFARRTSSLVDKAETELQSGSVYVPGVNTAVNSLGVVREQLVQLAELLYFCIGRDAFHSSRVDSDYPFFHDTSISLLGSLVSSGDVNTALGVTETYSDFNGLVSVCMAAPNAVANVDRYLREHGQEFAVAYFSWLLRHGRLHQLLTLSDPFNDHLSHFLASEGRQDLAWIHCLRIRDFHGAESALAASAKAEKRLDTFEVLNSVGKLVHIHATHGTCSRLSDDAYRKRQNAVTIHRHLLKNLGINTEVNHPRPDMSSLAKASCTSLDRFTGLKCVATSFLERCIRGEILEPEDLALALILKDSDPVEFRSAVAALCSSETLQRPTEYQDFAIRQIWRHAILQDNWPLLTTQVKNVGDDQLWEVLCETRTYATLEQFIAEGFTADQIQPISDLRLDLSHDSIGRRFPDQSSNVAAQVAHDLDAISNIIDGLVVECSMDSIVAEMARKIQSDDVVM